MTLVETLAAIRRTVEACGLWSAYDLTPRSINAPAVFPGAVESMRDHTQSGNRIAVVPLWIVYGAWSEDSQRQLYNGVEALWDALEASDASPIVRVVELTDVGDVDVSGTTYWGGRLRIEVYV